MKILLRPSGRNHWSNLIKYRNCYDYLGPYLTRSGLLYTGFGKHNEKDKKRLEDTLGLDLGPSSEYWTTFFVRAGAKDVYLDIQDPLDELRYIFLKDHKDIGSFGKRRPSARYILINQEEEAREENKFNRIKRKALREFDKMANDKEIKKCLRIFGHRADNMIPEEAENKLFEIVENNPEKFLEKWVDNKERDTEYLIEEAVSKNVIRKNKSVYTYGSDTIGNNKEDAVNYLDDLVNQDIKKAILKEVQAKI